MAMPNQIYQAAELPTQPNIPQKPMQKPGMFENWKGLQYGLGPVPWLAEYFSPGVSNKAVGGTKNFLFGTPQQTQQHPTVTPEVAQALNQILQQAMGNLTSNKFDFEPIRQQAITRFNQETIPSIANRFSALGGQGTSAFTQALGQAGAGLNENLAAMQQGYNLQQQGMNQNLLRMALMPQFENQIIPQEEGMLSGLLKNLLPAAAQLGIGYLTGGTSIIPSAMGALGSLSQSQNKPYNPRSAYQNTTFNSQGPRQQGFGFSF